MPAVPIVGSDVGMKTKPQLQRDLGLNIGIRPPAIWKLTRAETRVVASLAKGLRPVEIATDFTVSLHTIRTQIKRAMAKVGVHTQVALVARVYSAKDWRK